jgi:hypothetical protein
MAQPGNIAAMKFLADELIRQKTLPWEQVEVAVQAGDGECTVEEYRQYLALANRLRV